MAINGLSNGCAATKDGIAFMRATIRFLAYNPPPARHPVGRKAGFVSNGDGDDAKASCAQDRGLIRAR
jgi:hypothetical protein